MKNLFTLILAVITLQTGHAQLGVSAFTSGMHASKWDGDVNENDRSFYFNGNYVAIDYWLRLENQRIEFHPEVSFRTYKNYYEFRLIGFHLNTQVYPFSFFDDCDCPTFSKQEPLLEKGLFFQLSPGYNLMKVTSFSSLDPNIEVEDRDNFWDLGVGIGIDVGLSNIVTVTPTARYRFGFDAHWDRAPDFHSENSAGSPLRWYEFGIRIGLRFDADEY